MMKYLLMCIIAVTLMGCNYSQEGYIIQDEYGVQRGRTHSNKDSLQNPWQTNWVCINGVLSYSNRNDKLHPLYNTDKSLTTCEIIFVNKENNPTVHNSTVDQYSEVPSSRYNKTTQYKEIIVD